MHRFGDLYGYNGRIDGIYELEVAPRLPSSVGHETRYLDWTAAALYLNSQVEDTMQDLKVNLYGNPHSVHASSALTTLRIEQLRENLLDFFGADPKEYTLCFVRSATGALDYIGQLFPWSKQSRFVHSISNHNSVLGIREYAGQAGGRTSSISEEEIDDWLTEEEEESTSATYSLFAYPLYDNFGGSIYPRAWSPSMHRKLTKKGHRWLVSALHKPSHHDDPHALIRCRCSWTRLHSSLTIHSTCQLPTSSPTLPSFPSTSSLGTPQVGSVLIWLIDYTRGAAS